MTAAATAAIRRSASARSAASSAARDTAAAARSRSRFEPGGVDLAAVPQRQRIAVHHLAQLGQIGFGHRERAGQRIVLDPVGPLPGRAQVGRHLLQLVGQRVPDRLGRVDHVGHAREQPPHLADRRGHGDHLSRRCR